MDTSIIIPAWNEARQIHTFLETLSNVKSPSKTEIIFVAGGNDGTYEICSTWSSQQFVKIQYKKQRSHFGYSGAIHEGIKNASGQNIIILDSDTLVPPEWLTRIENALQTYDAVSCNYEPRKEYWLAKSFITVEKHFKLASGKTELYGGGTIAIKKSLIDKIGVNELISETLVDRNIHETLLANGHSIGRVDDITVGTEYFNNFQNMIRDFTDWRLRQIRYENCRPTDVSMLTKLAKSILIFSFPILLVTSITIFTLLHSALNMLIAVGLFVTGLVVMTIFLKNIFNDLKLAKRSSPDIFKYSIGYTIAKYFLNFTRITAWVKYTTR